MVRWSFPAKDGLKRIHDYIAEDSRFYAKNVAQNIIEKTENLNEFPMLGRVVPEIGNQKIREIIIYSYRIIYEINPKSIEILAIIHARQDFSSVESDILKK